MDRLSAASDLQYVSPQYLKGVTGGTAGWHAAATGGGMAVSDDTRFKYIGLQSVLFACTDTVSEGKLYQDVSLEPEKDYVFSVYMRLIADDCAEGGGVTLRVNDKDRHYGMIAETVPLTSGNTVFKRLQISFRTPQAPEGETVSRVRALVKMTGMKGRLWVDGAALEEGHVAGRLNLVVNNCFKKDLEGFSTLYLDEGDGPCHVLSGSEGFISPLSSDGTRVLDLPEGITTDLCVSDSCFVIHGDEVHGKRLWQRIDISGQEGDAYMVCGWGCTDGISLDDMGISDRGGRHCGIYVNFVAEDGTSDYHYADLGADVSEWQFLMAPIIARHDYDRINVGFCCMKSANTACFTGLGFYKEKYGTSYIYDSEGRVVSVLDKAARESSFEYDVQGNLKKLIDMKGNSFEYTYDSHHHPTGAESAGGVHYAFEYNAYGLPVRSAVMDPGEAGNGTEGIATRVVYTAGEGVEGQYIRKMYDPAGVMALYSWDEGKRGLLISAHDPALGTRSYTYDADTDHLLSTSGHRDAGLSGNDTEVTVSYSYTRGKLTGICHNGMDHTFSYDGFGRLTQVRAAGSLLVEHQYDSFNGLLKESIYSNGWKVRYTYDRFDRKEAVEILRGDTLVRETGYLYDRQGRLAAVTDSTDSGRNVWYSYDLSGRLCEARYEDRTGYRYSYDEMDCLTQEEILTGTGRKIIRRTYDADGRETQVQFTIAEDAPRISYVYDIYGRLERISRLNGAHRTFYTYETTESDGETGRLKSVRNHALTYTAEYDGHGRTVGMTRGTGENAKHFLYSYDTGGQLMADYDPDRRTYNEYRYDAGGSMIRRRTYEGVTETDTDDLEGRTFRQTVYSYDSIYKDRLVSMQMLGEDGTQTRNFVYDETGNLLSDGIRSYSWTNGRQLESVTKNASLVRFEYDASGERRKKISSGNTTWYIHSSGRLVAEKKGTGSWQYYIYDMRGQVMAVSYQGSLYYYVRDVLNTIVGLVDSNGSRVVSYSYDIWGRKVNVTGSLGSTLGADNPFRYKGYCYDEETGLYYLKSRYYDPETGRFISMDSPEVLMVSETEIQNKNLYVYCDNDPVMKADEAGCLPQIIVGAVIGAVAGFGGQLISDVITSVYDGRVTLSSANTYIGAVLGGALGAAVFVATGCPNAANMVTGFTTTGTSLMLDKGAGVNERSYGSILFESALDSSYACLLGAMPLPLMFGSTNKQTQNAYKGILKRNPVFKSRETILEAIESGLVSTYLGGFYLDGYYGVKQSITCRKIAQSVMTYINEYTIRVPCEK